MLLMIALAAICLGLIAYLRTDPIRRYRESGPISWRGGRRQITEEEAARITLDRLRVVSDGIRLNKYIAQAGVASRRRADELIAYGKVRINGKVVRELGTMVMPGDAVDVSGTPIAPTEDVAYLVVHKPRGRDDDDARSARTAHDRRTRAAQACLALYRSAGSITIRPACCS